jgi:hypothetical protein
MALHIVTANRLIDGDVVYLTRTNDWSEWIEDAAVAVTEEETETLLATGRQAESDRIVVGAYEFSVDTDGGKVTPVSMREIIRAAGPSVRRDLGKQAAER